MHAIVIRNGILVDGTGAPAREGALAIDGDRITAVGSDVGTGKREIDARGHIVTPGWVDIHTHYDAQVTWDPYVTPSSWHGVTTAVMGNCGVGFAPAHADEHDWLIQLMEGVEDIPGAAMTEGMAWEWESFPEYLDALERRPRIMDIGAQVPHGALRAYVMGERGAKNEPATGEDIERMAAIVREGIAAGALGFSTSRTFIHKGSDGEYVPGTFAEEDELFGIGRALAGTGRGVFQMTSNHADMDREVEWMHRLGRETGATLSFNLLQFDEQPDKWRKLLRMLDAARAEGVDLYAQIAGRPAGILMTWQGTAHPFLPYPSYIRIHQLPWAERLARLRDPAFKAQLLSEEPLPMGEFETFIVRGFHKMFRLGEQPDYEPDPSTSVAAIAAREGCRPEEIAYDLLMEQDGQGLIYFPIFNYSNGNIDHLAEMLRHPGTAMGLSDGGAHCGVICDASMPTFMLTHWVRDRARGDRLPLELIVEAQTRGTARVYGLHDRGVLAPGLKADVNVIDLDRLTLHAPRMAFDLPAGGRRLIQRASGYTCTIATGQVVMEGGEPTGALPGVLLRGPQAAPE